MSNFNKKMLKALPPARQMALKTLLHMQARGEKLQAALNLILSSEANKTDKDDKANALPGAPALTKDKALATELCYGCARLEIRLDWILDQHLKKPDQIPLALRRVLRLAAYELLYLTHIPVYAVISSYVGAVKAGFGPALAGLANAVLRKIATAPAYDEAFFKQRLPNANDFLSKWYSLPPWILQHFLNNYPKEDALAYMRSFLGQPPLGLRVNSHAASWQELFHRLAAREDCIFNSNNALALDLTPNLSLAAGANVKAGTLPPDFGALLGEGALSRQSAAAQQVMQSIFDSLAEEVKAALELGPIWDICAGHGGKTCWLLEQGYPVALASDVNLTRLRGLKQELRRLKLNSPLLLGANAARPMPLQVISALALPGIILVDAPCSGLGTLARRPDIKQYCLPSDLPQLAALQRQILHCSFDQLPVGGLLVYITCTLNPQENQDALGSLLQQKSEARQIFAWQTSPISVFKEFFWAGVLRKEAS